MSRLPRLLQEINRLGWAAIFVLGVAYCTGFFG
jgi:hypothetical protein